MKISYIAVDKDKLQNIIQENKNEHMKKYNEAMKGYRVGVVAGLEQLQEMTKNLNDEVIAALEEARNGGEMKTRFEFNANEPFRDLRKPENHGDEYETVIGMMELDMSDEVELGTYEYKNYVQDEWDWSRDWNVNITGSCLYNTSAEFSGSAGSINWDNVK